MFLIQGERTSQKQNSESNEMNCTHGWPLSDSLKQKVRRSHSRAEVNEMKVKITKSNKDRDLELLLLCSAMSSSVSKGSDPIYM